MAIVSLDTPFHETEFFKKNLPGFTVAEDHEPDSFDPDHVRLETCLEDGEISIAGMIRHARHKECEHKTLGGNAFLWYLEDMSRIPEEWKEKGIVAFYGTILRGPSGDRCVLYFDWHAGRRDWFYGWLDDDWSASEPSALSATGTPDNQDPLKALQAQLDMEMTKRSGNGIRRIGRETTHLEQGKRYADQKPNGVSSMHVKTMSPPRFRFKL